MKPLAQMTMDELDAELAAVLAAIAAKRQPAGGDLNLAREKFAFAHRVTEVATKFKQAGT